MLRIAVIVLIYCAVNPAFGWCHCDRAGQQMCRYWQIDGGEKIRGTMVAGKYDQVAILIHDSDHFVEVPRDRLSWISNDIVETAIDPTYVRNRLRKGAPGDYERRMGYPAYYDYQRRLSDRRYLALRQRYELSKSRGPARGWLAIRVPVDVMGGGSAIERGWVRQPPIPAPSRSVWVRSLPLRRSYPSYHQ